MVVVVIQEMRQTSVERRARGKNVVIVCVKGEMGDVPTSRRFPPRLRPRDAVHAGELGVDVLQSPGVQLVFVGSVAHPPSVSVQLARTVHLTVPGVPSIHRRLPRDDSREGGESFPVQPPGVIHQVDEELGGAVGGDARRAVRRAVRQPVLGVRHTSTTSSSSLADVVAIRATFPHAPFSATNTTRRCRRSFSSHEVFSLSSEHRRFVGYDGTGVVVAPVVHRRQ